MGPNVVNANKFFIHEFGINIHTRGNQGRSKKGNRVYRRVSGQRGSNITVCIAVSNQQGLVHYLVFAGRMTAERFSRFLEVFCGNKTLAHMNASGICIFDNARPPHIRISDLATSRQLSCSKTTEIFSASEHCRKSDKLLETSYQRIIGVPKAQQQFRFYTINYIISSTAGEVTQNANPVKTTRQPTFQLV